MDSIATSFDKSRINQCTNMCVMSLNYSRFTPEELDCFSRYLSLHLDAPEISIECTTMTAESAPIQTPSRSNSTIIELLLRFNHDF